MPELQEQIETLGKAVEEFKAGVAKQVQEHAKGVFEPLLEEKLKRINDVISETQTNISAQQKAIDEMVAKGARPGENGRTADSNKAHTDAFVKYLRTGEDSGLAEIQRKAMTVNSDPNGGYFVPVDHSGRIVQKVFETTPFRQICNVDTTTRDIYEGETDRDEVTSGWVGEVTSRTDTATSTVGKYQIQIGEIYAMPKISQKLLDDADRDVAMWLEQKLADKFSRAQNSAFAIGNGVNKPYGITAYTTAATADSSRSWGVLEHIAAGASGAFTSTTPQDKIYDMIYALKADYRQGATWIMPKAVLLLIRKFKDGQNNFIWQPSYVAGQPSTLGGYPVVESEDMPAVAANSLSAAFGNFMRGYTIVDRKGISTLRDPFTSKGNIVFYSTARVGGAVVDFEAIKLLKFATS